MEGNASSTFPEERKPPPPDETPEERASFANGFRESRNAPQRTLSQQAGKSKSEIPIRARFNRVPCVQSRHGSLLLKAKDKDVETG